MEERACDLCCSLVGYVCVCDYIFRIVPDRNYQNQEFPGGSVHLGSSVVTALAQVASVVRFDPRPWNFYIPQAQPKKKTKNKKSKPNNLIVTIWQISICI